MKTKLLSILALLLVAVSGAWAQDTYTVTFKANGNTVTVENVTLPKTFSCNYENGLGSDELDLIIQELYGLSEGCCKTVAPNSDNASVTCGLNGENNQYITVNAPFDGTATVTGRYLYANYTGFDYSLEITCPQPAPTGFTASFTAANAYTIKGGKASVSVDGGIATLDEEGKLPDINEGLKVTITAKPGYKFRKVVAEPEGDFVTFTDGTNTVTVAKMNLGATTVADSPETSYGSYYAWGATTTSTEYIDENAPYFDSNTWGYTKYTSAADGIATLEAADDAVAANMPGYHMPTLAELETLFNACGGDESPTETISEDQAYPTTAGIYWVAGGNTAVKIGDDTYSVNGMLFVQDADHHVFFPAAGYVDGTTLYGVGIGGCYWYSSLDTENNDYAYRLSFDTYSVYPVSNHARYKGLPVRPFKD